MAFDLVDESAINIYSDGSCYGNPRRGGIGIRFVYVADDGHEVTEDVAPPGYKDATNQEMELKACIQALELLRRGKTNVPTDRFQKILIHSDSQYVVNNFRNALHYWQLDGWRGRDGAPIVNADLWNQLIKVVSKTEQRVGFTWVKGHKSSPHNKVADKLAKASANMALNGSLHVGQVRRKQTDRQVEPGCVKLYGQRLTIHIVTERYLPRQKLTQYRYEVMSRKSPYYGLVDFVYSSEILHRGHTYYVRVNDDTNNPTLVKVYREVDRKTGASRATGVPK